MRVLADYTTRGGERRRVDARRRIDGGVCLVDAPVSADGPEWVVGHFDSEEGEPALEALVADYLTRARVSTLPLARRVRVADFYEDLGTPQAARRSAAPALARGKGIAPCL